MYYRRNSPSFSIHQPKFSTNSPLSYFGKIQGCHQRYQAETYSGGASFELSSSAFSCPALHRLHVPDLGCGLTSRDFHCLYLIRLTTTGHRGWSFVWHAPKTKHRRSERPSKHQHRHPEGVIRQTLDPRPDTINGMEKETNHRPETTVEAQCQLRPYQESDSGVLPAKKSKSLIAVFVIGAPNPKRCEEKTYN